MFSKPAAPRFLKVDDSQTESKDCQNILAQLPKENPYPDCPVKHTGEFGRKFTERMMTLRLKLKKPVSKTAGYCNGLTILYLYMAAINNLDWFYLINQSIMTGQGELRFARDREIFMDAVFFWQAPETFDVSLSYTDMGKFLNTETEYTHFKGSPASLLTLLKTVEPNSLVYIASTYTDKELKAVGNRLHRTFNNHAIGMYYTGENYMVFNTGYEHGITFSTPELTEAVVDIVSILRPGTYPDYVPLLIKTASAESLRLDLQKTRSVSKLKVG
jgi:hypothetical protein